MKRPIQRVYPSGFTIAMREDFPPTPGGAASVDGHQDILAAEACSIFTEE